MSRLRILLASVLAYSASLSFAQTGPDSTALEGVIVERYYVADENDASDEDGSAQLVPGSVTYRVFLDMKDGYEFQYLSGEVGHAITFNTTTSFFNNEDRGETWADALNDIHLDKNTVAIDSWLAVGAASDAHWGVLKSDDPDGAQDGVLFPNDGGSNGVPDGLLTNDDPFAGIPLTDADGLMAVDSAPPASTSLGDFPECFNTTGSSFTSENFGLAVLGDVPCPTPGNKILIGQFTTDGVFSFCMNVWLRIPDSLVCNDCQAHIEFYPSVNSTDTVGPEGAYRFAFAPLCWSSDQQSVDCLGVPGGPALPGSSCDDGIAATTNDVYDNACVCVGEDCLGVLGGNALPGQPCDDGDPDSVNDTWQDSCICIGAVGIEENTSALVSIHPNPVNDLLRVRLEHATGELVSLSLRNALGEQLMHRSLGNVSGTLNEFIELSSLAGGLYFVEVTIGQAVQVERITKF
jgi:hypothetical protein